MKEKPKPDCPNCNAGHFNGIHCYDCGSDFKRATTLREIVDHHLNGGKFKYESYDHKLAEAEFKTTEEFKHLLRENYGFTEKSKLDKMIIPEKIRNKHAIMKPGKLRSVDFAPDGSIRSVKIGNKKPMNFYKYTCDKVLLLRYEYSIGEEIYCHEIFSKGIITLIKNDEYFVELEDGHGAWFNYDEIETN